MANKQQRQQLYEWFETGDRPSQLQFEDFIDSMINQQDDDIWVDDEEVFNGQTNPYQGFIGIGNRQPVTKLSLSGSMIVGAGWASDRINVPSANVPDDGMLIEGSVKIGTVGNIATPNPDGYRLEIKNKPSGLTGQDGERPFRIDSDNHGMIVFGDSASGPSPLPSTKPYTLLEEGGYGFRFYSYRDAGDNRETMRITKDGFVGIRRPVPGAMLDVNANAARGLKIETTNNDAIVFDGIGNSNPFTIVDEADRGFRFYNNSSSGNAGEQLRITPAGNVGIGVQAPGYKLHVDGHLALNAGGQIYGQRPNNDFLIFSNTDQTNGSYIQMSPNNGADKKGSIAFISSINDAESGFRFVNYDASNVGSPWSHPVKIENYGKVGINIPDAPTNQLDLQGSAGGTDTGLRLRSGAGDRKILASDATGNASWMALSMFVSEGVVPVGAIIMWSGSVTVLPVGWALCDGENGRPDLRGRFIVAYDGRGTSPPPSDPNFTAWDANYSAVHNVGGAKQVILTEAQIPNHTHQLSPDEVTALDTGSEHQHNTPIKQRDFTGGHPGVLYGDDIDAATHYFPSDTSGNHSHQVSGSTDPVGNDQPHENRPPYYVLAFIIKI